MDVIAGMREGRDAFNRGEFFEAHELWEDVWNEIDDPEWTWVQGLIQIATGLHKLVSGRRAAAEESFRRALMRLADAPAELWGVDVAGAVDHARALVAAIERGERPTADGVRLREL